MSNCNDARSLCLPCNPAAITALNEPLDSELANFILNFYGVVTKTVVNGAVVWGLPCDLDTGLPGNPRLTGESTACYFLRLFRDGIVGLKGDPGVGTPGIDGASIIGLVATSFTAPSLTAPNFTANFSAISWATAGQVVFISSLGWARVTAKTGDLMALTLLELITGSAPSILAGNTVTPAGPQGRAGPVGYVLTTAAFTPPTVGNNVVVSLSSVEIVLSNMRFFIEASGYYTVISTGAGSAVMRLDTAVTFPVSPVPSGSKVIPS